MKTKLPSPQTTLVILLGASAWPRSPELDGSPAFARAANELRHYFLDPHGFHLPAENLLDRFDSDQYAGGLDEEISQFLEQHIAEKRRDNIGEVARDVLVYFIGHGGISEGTSDFYLAIRRTRQDNPKGSSIEIGNLAQTLKEKARFQRRVLVLDCCFAASAVRFFQGSGPMEVIREKMKEVFEEQEKGQGFPSRGTTFLCSSSKMARSRILPDETATMFTHALVHVLRTGSSFQKENLSLYGVKRLTTDFLLQTYGEKAPRPEVHSPDQTEGDVADIPFFPNLAILMEQSQIQQKPKAEDKKSQVARDPVGAILDGKFKIVQVLGKGSMSIVYKVEQVGRPGYFWAVKQLLINPNTPEEERKAAIERFDKEIEILSNLKHPRIPSLIRSFQEHGNYYFVMEFVPGRSLDKMLEDNKGPLDEERVIRWMMQVCEALSYIHSRTPPIILRDLKPGNVTVTPEGDVQLIDFSIARRFDPNKRTNTESLGTISYASPEHLGSITAPGQRRSAQNPGRLVQTDARSDIYSLGATMYHLLTNYEPDPIQTPAADSIYAKNPRLRTVQINGKVICPIEQVIIKAMQQDPTKRFQRAEAMHVALQHCLSK